MNILKLIFLTTSLTFGFNSASLAQVIFLNINSDKKFEDEVKRSYKNQTLYTFPNAEIKQIGRENYDQLVDHIRTFFQKTSLPSQFIISGHHSGGEFSGINGRIELIELEKIISEKFPELKESITHIYADGCYTATLAMVLNDQHWRAIFPNAQVIFGNQSKSWDKSNRRDINVVNTVLGSWKRWAGVISPDALATTFNSITDWSTAEFALWMGNSQDKDDWLYLSTNDVLLKRSAFSIKGAKQECRIKQSNYKQKLHSIGQYYYASSGLSPPKNPHNSKLRSNYNWIRTYEYCNTIGFPDYP
jgi:hypothetical protein